MCVCARYILYIDNYNIVTTDDEPPVAIVNEKYQW